MNRFTVFAVSVILCIPGLSQASAQVAAPEAAVEEAVAAPIEVGNKICPVSGEKIGSMGDGYRAVHEGKVYMLCCMGCAKDFEKDPAKFSKIADDEVTPVQ